MHVLFYRTCVWKIHWPLTRNGSAKHTRHASAPCGTTVSFWLLMGNCCAPVIAARQCGTWRRAWEVSCTLLCFILWWLSGTLKGSCMLSYTRRLGSSLLEALNSLFDDCSFFLTSFKLCVDVYFRCEIFYEKKNRAWKYRFFKLFHLLFSQKNFVTTP